MNDLSEVISPTQRLPDDGRALQRSGTKYVTAIAVQTPRDLAAVRGRVMREVELLGERAFYRWSVKDKGSGRASMIEGPSVKLAIMAVRNWGNAAVDLLPTQDTGDAWIFTAAFVDLETGFTLTRQFRQSKKWTVHGRMDAERKDDVRFQIGQSKAIRNVVLSAVPGWLIGEAVDVAKRGAREKIEDAIKSKGGVAAVTDRILAALRQHGVTEDRVLKQVGKSKVEALTIDDLVALNANCRAIADGEEYADALFPGDAATKTNETTASIAEELAKQRAERAKNGTPETFEPEKANGADDKLAAPRALLRQFHLSLGPDMCNEVLAKRGMTFEAVEAGDNAVQMGDAVALLQKAAAAKRNDQ